MNCQGWALKVAGIALCTATAVQAQDARVGLGGGAQDAQTAAWNLELVAHQPRSTAFTNPSSATDVLSDLLFANSDIAFRGDLLFLGNFNGFQIYDISNPRAPKLRTPFVCPGGQGDVSVHGNLLFMSVEMPNGRIDCGPGGVLTATPVRERFMGVRIFDISNVDKPKQVAAVQTCRGSHTHTLVTDARDPKHVYIYVSGSSTVRPAEELAGCSNLPPAKDPNTSYFRIEVIKVPVALPQHATIVNMPRIFADSAGNIAGLWPGGRHGEGTQETATTNQCHDITAYPAIGLAAGACSGNGILLDISDPANPQRVEEVMDPNFAYWHSATFNNDGTKVIFTDEWGGGTVARCLASDRREWGADAIFELKQYSLTLASYYKLPAPQSESENCVAHNGSLIPVPGRDILAQGWYQGGISIVDFTDARNPIEIAYFDRGPYDDKLRVAGAWGAYWYNGYIYSPEMLRGLDVLALTPSAHLSQNEIDAARLVRLAAFNPQTQPRITWPASFVVARAYVDQLRRSAGLSAEQLTSISSEIARAERLRGATRSQALRKVIGSLNSSDGATAADARRVSLLAQTLRDLAK